VHLVFFLHVLGMNTPQIVILTGPTATGKTALAIEFAIRYGAEIISADSRQVYRYLDIGTAKPTPEQRAAVPHHLIDVVNPDEQFDGARFRTQAIQAIHHARQRGKRMLVVGGTGLYLRALTRGLFQGPPANPPLRAQLQEQERTEGKGFLHRWLSRVDPTTGGRLHPNDIVRQVRALEVFLLTGAPMSRWQQEHGFCERPFSTLTISLMCDRETLHRRIEARCQQMIRDGLLEELRQVWAMGYDPALPVFQTIGYAQMGALLQGRLGYEEALTQMATETKRLAKRQLTWLRTEPEVQWVTPLQKREMATALEKFWNEGYRADDVLRI
jgi:tRNA dimethylallyltransferase